MVWKPYRFRHQSRWTPRRSNRRGNKKPGHSGFFIACRLVCSRIACFGLGSLGRAQTSNFFGISQQRSINFDPVARLNRARIRVSHDLAKNPQRALRQIQLRKLCRDARCVHRRPNADSFSNADRTQNLPINRRVHDFYLDHRLNHASAWRAGRKHPPAG